MPSTSHTTSKKQAAAVRSKPTVRHDDDATPKGTPTSDRSATEQAVKPETDHRKN